MLHGHREILTGHSKQRARKQRGLYPEGHNMLFKKQQKIRTYDREKQKPVIRSSICTGEKVAGFQELHTGKFTEVMLLRTPDDLAEFRRLYGIGEEEIQVQY